MRIRFWKQRQIWWPTRWGWLLFLALVVGPAAWWWFKGEAFLATSRKVDAEILVVEGWIANEALADAAREFEQGGYRYVITAGGLTDHAWSEQRWSYAEVGAVALRRAGVDAASIVEAPARESDQDRTYETAVAVRRVLRARGDEGKAINVFTLGTHARRSRMVFRKVFEGEGEVGVIAWLPPRFEETNWRSSSERAKEYLTESVGFAYEFLWSSGRDADRLEEDLKRSEAAAEPTNPGAKPPR